MTPSTLRKLAAEQWVRRPVARVDLELPLPVSTNNLWEPSKKGMRLTKAYARWKADAGRALEFQRPGRVPGEYELAVAVSSTCRADLSNTLKGAEDLLQAHGVIDDDRLARRILLHWSDEIEGMRLTVSAVSSILEGAR